MPDIVVVGAGDLGGAVAHRVARHDAASSVVIVDDGGTVAAGKALDIVQAAPVERFSTRVTGSTDLVVAAGARLIVVADRARGGEWSGDEGLLLLRRLRAFAGEPIVICAGAAQRDLVERGVRELGYARERLFGSAPHALAAALRAIVALEADSSPRDVSLAVLGVPPSGVVVPWEEATIDGFSATRRLDAPARRRLAARVPHLWPPGPLALAAAAAAAARAVLGRSHGVLSAFVAPDDGAGRRSRAGSLPVKLGRDGVERVLRLELSAHDRVAFENAMSL
jgi:malate dehydrogenase